MRKALNTLTVITVLGAAAGLQAAEPNAGEDLARKNACTACHAVEQKLIGPSFKEIAAKYKGQNGGAAMLGEKVKKGSSGAWGQVPMPPNGHIPDEDIQTIVAWILAI